MNFGIVVRRLIGDIQSLQVQEQAKCQSWEGWQPLLDLTLNPEPFTQSGQIKQIHGVLPWVYAGLKAQGFAGVEIGLATENSQEISAELKTEAEVLAFFGTDLDSVRGTAEVLGLLKPKLNLAALPDSDDCWF